MMLEPLVYKDQFLDGYDGHVHLENGPLSLDYLQTFVDAAKEKGIKHLQILDHTHRFYEFAPMYKDVIEADERQKIWFENKQVNSIQDYIDLIEQARKIDFGIDVSFGLEVCWTSERKEFLKKQLAVYPFDFLVGSVHAIDGKLYDMSGWSKELLWDTEPAEYIYQTYYQELLSAIESGLFTQIGHPDVIKLYQVDPGYDLTPTWRQIARAAAANHVWLEDNTGAYYRYHHPELGLNSDFRTTILEEGGTIIPASDAHYAKHVGMELDELPMAKRIILPASRTEKGKHKTAV